MKKKPTSRPKENASLVHFVVRNHKIGDRERIYILGCSTNFAEIVRIFQQAVNNQNEDPIAIIDTIGLWYRLFTRGEANIKIRILSVRQNDLLALSLNY